MPDLIEEKDIGLLKQLIDKLQGLGLSSKYAAEEERKLSEYSQKLVASYNQLTRSASGFESAIRSQYKQTQATQDILKKLGKTQEEVHKITSDMISVILGEKKASEQISKAFIEQRKTLEILTKKEEEAVRIGKALEYQTKSMVGKFELLSTSLSKTIGWKTAIGSALGLSFGIKELGSTLEKYNRGLFESTRVASVYGQSLASMKRGIEEASQKTTLSKQAFLDINKAFQEMYVGIPLTTSAVANLASKLQNNLGYSAEMTAKAMQDLLSLQGRMPDAVDRVSDAIDAYSSGSGDAIQKTMALRGHLRDLGLSAQDTRKYMMMVKPPSLETKGLLGYEKTAAEKTQALEDAQLSTAQKLENQMKLLNKAMTGVLKIWQIMPASVIQVGAAMVGVAAVAPGLMAVAENVKKIAFWLHDSSIAATMLKGNLTSVNVAGIPRASMPNVPIPSFQKPGIPIPVRGTSIPLALPSGVPPIPLGANPYGVGAALESQAVGTTTMGRWGRMGAGIRASAPMARSIGGAMVGMAQISGLQEVATGGAESRKAVEEEWKNADVGQRIGMGFSGKGLAVFGSKLGRGLAGGGFSKDKSEIQSNAADKSATERKRFEEGFLKQRTALKGESPKDLEDQNKMRQKAVKIYSEQLAKLKENKVYRDAEKSEDFVKMAEMESAMRSRVTVSIKTAHPALKDNVKVQEDNNKKLEDEINLRSQIQDTVDRTISMLKISGEKLGGIKSARDTLMEQIKLGNLPVIAMGKIEDITKLAATEISVAQEKSNNMLIDAIGRAGGKGAAKLDEIMKKKGVEGVKEYAKSMTEEDRKSIIKANADEIDGLTKKGITIGSNNSKLNDYLAIVEKVSQGDADVAKARESAAKTVLEAQTLIQERALQYIDIDSQIADAEARRAKAYNLGVHAGYDALNKQIDAQRRSIQETEKAIKTDEELQQVQMKEFNLGGIRGKTPGELDLEAAKKIKELTDKGDEKSLAQAKSLTDKQTAMNETQKKITNYRLSLIDKETKIAELTKEVMEGYLAANKEFIANAGVFSGIIGSTKKGIAQLIGKEVGAAAGKWSGVEGGAEGRTGARVAGYTVSGAFAGPGRNYTDEYANRMQPRSGTQLLQSPESQRSIVAAQQENVARSGGAKVIVVESSANKGEVGTKKFGTTVNTNYQKPFDVQDVYSQASGGPTPSGYVINKQKTDQYKDLISMLNPSIVGGGIPGKDSVPVPGVGLLMPGEAIVTGEEESALAEMINKGQIKGMARGGRSYGVGSRNKQRSMGGMGIFGSSYAIGSKNEERRLMGRSSFSFNSYQGGRGSGKARGISGTNLYTSYLGGTTAPSKDLGWGGNEDFSKNKDVVTAMSLRSSLSNQTPAEQATNMKDNLEIAKWKGIAAEIGASGVGAASGGRFGGNGIQIRQLASGGNIQVPRGLARQFASSPSSSGSGEMTLKLNPEVRDLLVADGRKNYNSGTRV